MSGAQPLAAEAEAQALVDAGALFVVNHSGGKDGQAALIRVLERVPAAQILVAHASLGRSEWPGALEHAQAQAEAAGVPFLVAKSSSRASMIELVRFRAQAHPEAPAFPSASNRQCTSDLKRDPIMREVRKVADARKVPAIVTVMGMRAQESRRRAKARTWALDKRGSRADRPWYTWLPVHGFTTEQVFATIHGAGQRAHWAYYGPDGSLTGNERLSCVFCILGSRHDARHGALYNPELFAEHVALERETGATMHAGVTLEQYAGLTVAEARAQRRSLPVLGQ